jgi:MFS family permease
MTDGLSSPAQPRPSTRPAGRRSEAYAWYVVGVLTLAFMLAMLDRMLLVLLITPIKAGLGLSDTEISLLHGLAFTALYVLCGIPIARIADRTNRSRVIGASIVAWSFATAACGAATGFWSLFASRMAVGVGEAGLSPAANSIIADYFPPERLSRPIAYYSLGGTAGSGISLIFGGVLIEWLMAQPLVLPYAGALRPWQAAFVIAGLVGLFFAALIATIAEPPRREAPNGLEAETRALLPFLRGNRRYLAFQMTGSALAGAAILGMHAWFPTMLVRRFGWAPGETGFHYGVVVAIASIAGVLLGGWIVQRLARGGRTNSAPSVALWSVVAAIVPASLAPLLPGPVSCLAAAGSALFLLSIPVALAPAGLQLLAPSALRGQVYAVYVVVLSIIAYVGAPFAVALFTDHLFADEAMVGGSIALLCAVCTLGSSALLRYARLSAPSS